MTPIEMLRNVNPAAFKADMQAKYPGMTPQEIVSKMVTSGQITTAQYENARSLANMLGIKM